MHVGLLATGPPYGSVPPGRTGREGRHLPPAFVQVAGRTSDRTSKVTLDITAEGVAVEQSALRAGHAYSDVPLVGNPRRGESGVPRSSIAARLRVEPRFQERGADAAQPFRTLAYGGAQRAVVTREFPCGLDAAGDDVLC